MPIPSQDDAPLRMTHARLAWALHEWTTLLAEATNSLYAERYYCAAATVVGSLDPINTMHELAQVFFSPPTYLKVLVLALCLDEEIDLFPHELLGASCALRLRQLLAEISISDAG
jgi:hypothetical protein